MTERPHARAFDLPGWPCPPRVRDIASHENSWGHVFMSGDTPGLGKTVVQDERGYLWANGDTIPQFRLPDDGMQSPGAVPFWTKEGLGAYIHPKSLRFLGNISRLDMQPDQWIPIAVAAAVLPEFITAL